MSKTNQAIDLVVGELLEGITSGEYTPGEKVNAASLSTKLNCSIAPVREALHILAGQGVIELVPNRGAILRAMGKEDIRDYWHFAKALGRLGIELATPRMREPESRELLQQQVAYLKESLPSLSGQAFFLATTNFHLILNNIAGNRFLLETTNQYMIRYWGQFLSQEIPYDQFRTDYIRNYQRIAESILCGDAPAAIAAWEYHVNWSLAFLGEDNIPQPDQPWFEH